MKSVLLKILNYSFYFVSIAAGLFIANGEALFGSNPQQKLTLVEIRYCTGIFLVLVLTMFLINFVRKKYKPSWILLSITFIICLTNILSIATFKNQDVFSFVGVKGEYHEFVYSISAESKFLYSLQAVVLYLTFFVIIDFGHQLFKTKEFLTIISIGAIAIVLVFIIISYVTEWKRYATFFSNFYNITWLTPQSIFINSNVYAVMLTISLISFIFLHIIFKKWFLLLPIIFVYANIVFSWCRSLMVLNLLIVVAYLIFHIFTKYGSTKKRMIITASIIFGSLCVLVGATLLTLHLTGKLDQTINFVFSDSEFFTVRTRTWIWQRSIMTLRYGNWVTGVGNNIFNELLYNFNVLDVGSYSNSAHNAALELLGTGGLITLISALAILGMLIYLSIKYFKYNRSICFGSLLLITFSLMFGVLESGFFIFPRTYGFAFLTFLIAIPVISNAKENSNKMKRNLG